MDITENEPAPPKFEESNEEPEKKKTHRRVRSKVRKHKDTDRLK